MEKVEILSLRPFSIKWLGTYITGRSYISPYGVHVMMPSLKVNGESIHDFIAKRVKIIDSDRVFKRILVNETAIFYLVKLSFMLAYAAYKEDVGIVLVNGLLSEHMLSILKDPPRGGTAIVYPYLKQINFSPYLNDEMYFSPGYNNYNTPFYYVSKVGAVYGVYDIAGKAHMLYLEIFGSFGLQIVADLITLLKSTYTSQPVNVLHINAKHMFINDRKYKTREVFEAIKSVEEHLNINLKIVFAHDKYWGDEIKVFV